MVKDGNGELRDVRGPLGPSNFFTYRTPLTPFLANIVLAISGVAGSAADLGITWVPDLL